MQNDLRATPDNDPFLKDVIDKTADGILLLDEKGCVRFSNPAAAQILGRAADELVGEAFTFSVVAGDMIELDIPRPDGKYVAAEVRVAATSWRGKPALLVNLRDVSVRKELEQQLRHAQKMEAVGRLAGGVAHDFNNLLTAIIGHSEIAISRKNCPEEVQEDLAEIRRAAERAASLTRRLLSLNHRHLVRPQVLNLNDLLTQMRGMIASMMGENIQFILALDPQLSHVSADPVQIEQVLLNLIINARDAMPRGGKLVIETRNVVEQASGENLPCRFVQLTVTDNGAGIDPRIQPRIFEPFFTTKPPDLGTGLGLSTVYGIIRQIQGHIHFQSAIGAGTTFRIRLPRFEMPANSEKRISDKPPDVLSGESILVVEDQPVVRRLVVKILRNRGYTVHEARSSPVALDIARDHRNKISLLLTDVIMPEINGPDLAEQLTAVCPKLKVLFMSGYTDGIMQSSGEATSEDGFLQKPFTAELLLAQVRKTLDHPRTSPRRFPHPLAPTAAAPRALA